MSSVKVQKWSQVNSLTICVIWCFTWSNDTMRWYKSTVLLPHFKKKPISKRPLKISLHVWKYTCMIWLNNLSSAIQVIEMRAIERNVLRSGRGTLNGDPRFSLCCTLVPIMAYYYKITTKMVTTSFLRSCRRSNLRPSSLCSAFESNLGFKAD